MLRFSKVLFIRPFQKRTYYVRPTVRLSVCLSVRLSVCPPSVRQSSLDFFQHALRCQFETWYMHSVGGTTWRVWIVITIGSFWPSLQPKVGQTQFLQSWPYKWRLILQIWYVSGQLYTSGYKFHFVAKIVVWRLFWCVLDFSKFSGLFSICFEISIWNIVYTLSR